MRELGFSVPETANGKSVGNCEEFDALGIGYILEERAGVDISQSGRLTCGTIQGLELDVFEQVKLLKVLRENNITVGGRFISRQIRPLPKSE